MIQPLPSPNCGGAYETGLHHCLSDGSHFYSRPKDATCVWKLEESKISMTEPG